MIGSVVGKENAVAPKFNASNWSTDSVEQALPVLNGSTSPLDRWTAAQTILTGIHEQLPYVPLFNPNLVYAIADGFAFDRDMSFYDFVNGSWVTAVKATS